MITPVYKTEIGYIGIVPLTNLERGDDATCSACIGEECWKCGPHPMTPCEHDVIDRHDTVRCLDDPAPPAVDATIEAGCWHCNGNGGPWPKYPTMCGGVPCPTCDGVCVVCLGELLRYKVLKVLPVVKRDTVEAAMASGPRIVIVPGYRNAPTNVWYLDHLEMTSLGVPAGELGTVALLLEPIPKESLCPT